MHLGEELVVLGILLLIAYVLGRAGKLIGLPAIPIYMVVGLAASPYTGWFPISFDGANLEFIAIFGLILLLFNLGLEFDLDEFFSNAGKLIVSGGSYIAINMGVGLLFGYWVGWGGREALIIAGITATSSSAIVTKLLIELKRLPNRETPMILGVTVVEDIFIAIYLAIVGVVLSGENEIWVVVGNLGISFLFLIVMFSIARWGGKVVSRLIRTKDDELFTVLFFGLAVLFGGIGELLGVTDAIGAFLIGLVLGATRFRSRIETLSTPMRDLFGAFFFLNFGLALDITTFGSVVGPVLAAVGMTVVLNILGGQFIAWINGLGAQAGINATVILQNRGEFALILATLAMSAGLDERIVPFAGLYVLMMAIMGPIVAANSERIGSVILRTKKKKRNAQRDRSREEAIALMEGATTGADAADDDLDGSRPASRPRTETDAALSDEFDEFDAVLAGGRIGSEGPGVAPSRPRRTASAAPDPTPTRRGGGHGDAGVGDGDPGDIDADGFHAGDFESDDFDTDADAAVETQASDPTRVDAATDAARRIAEQANEQSDVPGGRVRDPEY